MSLNPAFLLLILSFHRFFFQTAFVDPKVNSIIIQGDGKILVGGTFLDFKSSGRNYILRLNRDGTIDNHFQSTLNPNGFVNTLSLQNDGKILIGGNFVSVNQSNAGYFARLNPDGSRDLSCNTGLGFNSWVHTLMVQSDGKIIVGGDFTQYNGVSAGFLIRLNPDGSIDSGFNTGTGFNSSVYALGMQSDGKIIVGGSFTAFNGSPQQNIVRLNTNGSLDTGFSSSTNNAVSKVQVQSDGKILICGYFRDSNGQNSCFQSGGNQFCSFLNRLNTDGSTDNGFLMNFKADSYIHSIQLQTDGKILIGGLFKKLSNGSRELTYHGLARINPDGSLDENFSIADGADEGVYSMAVQADGKILVGGKFKNFNKTPKSFLARIDQTGMLDTGF